jgi:hypothetical protein
VSYPDHQASLLINQLNVIASANGGNVFLGELERDPHNSDYWSVLVDITKHDWHRLQGKLVQAGWQRFGDNDEMIHSLPEQHFIVARPSF